MPRCCITKRLVDALLDQNGECKDGHYYDEEVEGFMLESRGLGRGTWYFRYQGQTKKWRHFRIGSLAEVSLTDARMKCCSLRRLVEDGVDIHTETYAIQEKISLENFVEHHYLPHVRAKKRSWDLDSRMLRLHILPRFGETFMTSIRTVDVAAWQEDLRAKGLAPASCNRVFVLLKTIFNCAVRWGSVDQDKNPCQGVRPFADKGTRERYLTPDEAQRLLHALHNARAKKSAQAIQLLLFTGARKNEILSARWEDVDLEHHLLTVPLSKSGKPRHIPLSDEAVQVFDSIGRGQSPWVFPQSKGEGHITSVFALWERLRKELGLSDVRLHDLRHSFASFLVNAGRSLYEVQCCFGHSNPRITMRYAHLARNSLVTAANSVSAVIHNVQDCAIVKP